MKYSTWKTMLGFKTEEAVRQYFRKNLYEGMSGPVCAYVCPKCDEMLGSDCICRECSKKEWD